MLQSHVDYRLKNLINLFICVVYCSSKATYSVQRHEVSKFYGEVKLSTTTK